MMNNSNEKIDLKRLEQKTYNEFLKDGIMEIFAGVVLFFCPILYLNPIFVVYIPLFMFFSPPLLENIRERTTYPRIGRVEFIRDGEREDYSIRRSIQTFLLFLVLTLVITIIVMFVIDIIIGEMVIETTLVYKWIPLWFGLIMFGPSLFLVDKTGEKYYYLFGIFSAILGFSFSLVIFPDIYIRIILFFFSLGIIILCFGIIKYLFFIHNYPVIHFEEE